MDVWVWGHWWAGLTLLWHPLPSKGVCDEQVSFPFLYRLRTEIWTVSPLINVHMYTQSLIHTQTHIHTLTHTKWCVWKPVIRVTAFPKRQGILTGWLLYYMDTSESKPFKSSFQQALIIGARNPWQTGVPLPLVKEISFFSPSLLNLYPPGPPRPHATSNHPHTHSVFTLSLKDRGLFLLQTTVSVFSKDSGGQGVEE